MKALNIGFGASVLSQHILTILPPESAPIKRLVQQAKEMGTLIDATFGRKARAVLVLDTQSIVLSATQAETLMNRLNEDDAVKRADPA